MAEKKKALPTKFSFERNLHDLSPKTTSVVQKCKGKLQALQLQVQNTLNSFQDTQESIHASSSKEELSQAFTIIDKLRGLLSKRQSVQLLNSLAHTLRKMHQKTKEEYESIIKGISSLMQSLSCLDKDFISIMKGKQRLNLKGLSTYRSNIRTIMGNSTQKPTPRVTITHRCTRSSKDLNEDLKLPSNSSQFKHEATAEQNKQIDKTSLLDIDCSNSNEPSFFQKEDSTCEHQWDINTFSKMTYSILENSLGKVEYKVKSLEHKVMNKLPEIFEELKMELQKKKIEVNKYKTKSKLRNAIIRTLELQLKTAFANNNSDNSQYNTHLTEIKKTLMAMVKKIKLFCEENEKILNTFLVEPHKNVHSEEHYGRIKKAFQKLDSFLSRITEKLQVDRKEGRSSHQNQYLLKNYQEDNKNLISNLNTMLFSLDIINKASQKVKNEIDSGEYHRELNISELNKERTLEITPNYLYTSSLKENISEMMESIVQVFNSQSQQINELRSSQSPEKYQKFKKKYAKYKRLYVRKDKDYNLLKLEFTSQGTEFSSQNFGNPRDITYTLETVESKDLTNLETLEEEVAQGIQKNKLMLQSIQKLNEFKDKLSLLCRDNTRYSELTNSFTSFSIDCSDIYDSREFLSKLIDHIENIQDRNNLNKFILNFFQKLDTLSPSVQDSIVSVVKSSL